MNNKRTVFVFTFLLSISAVIAQQQQSAIDTIYIEWNQAPASGKIEVLNGRLQKISIKKGKGSIRKDQFIFKTNHAGRLEIIVEEAVKSPGPGATIVTSNTPRQPFSFFLRDVNAAFPIYLPASHAVVLTASDRRSFQEVEQSVHSRGSFTKLQTTDREPEASFDAVAKVVRDQHTPTWLGIARDFRIFQLNETTTDLPMECNVVMPKFAAMGAKLPAMKNNAAAYMFNAGRGQGVELNTTRRLEQGVMPILHSKTSDEQMVYTATSFVALEQSPLTAANVKGTDFLVADQYSHGHMFTKEQDALVRSKLKNAFDTNEETVFCYSAVAENTGAAPAYAWFKTPRPGEGWWQQYPYTYDPRTGFSAFPSDSVFCISFLNGKPLPNEEIAVLLQPGEKAVFEFYLPHSPIPENRAASLSKATIASKLEECKAYWNNKLSKAAQIQVPEQRVDEMIRAGLLHLDLITYGKEPDSTLAPAIGVYSPIGTESAPIIQFYLSMGWYDIAKRSLNYFLDKQHEDGMIQNFGGYMVETGAALWTMGEYYRYTRDKAWLASSKEKLIKSCDFLFAWREKNKREELRGKGYGMIDGKVADPEDHFHQFMLNGYAYLGCARIAEVLTNIDPQQAARIKKEADAWKEDIRASFFNSMKYAPVVPLGNGTWVSSAAPWTEMTGPRALYVKAEKFFSHGTFTTADALLGPMYLVFCEVLDAKEPASWQLLNYYNELFFQHNAAFSQPYYSRHNWMQAKLGMVKPFLKTYYNTFAAHADRETYTFWEHLFHVSVHKTHEEAWFLMETRWMLYLEDSSALRLLNTVPRAWLENGKQIRLNNFSSYFGKLKVEVTSAIDKGNIKATVECPVDRGLKTVSIRLPHPEGKKAMKVSGGTYDAETETITIPSFNGKAEVLVEY
ncbi:MAG: hypothetical protein ACTHLE_18610 [Agriterribacter sp.]